MIVRLIIINLWSCLELKITFRYAVLEHFLNFYTHSRATEITNYMCMLNTIYSPVAGKIASSLWLVLHSSSYILIEIGVRPSILLDFLLYLGMLLTRCLEAFNDILRTLKCSRNLNSKLAKKKEKKRVFVPHYHHWHSLWCILFCCSRQLSRIKMFCI